MQDKYFILKAMLVGFAVFFFRYFFYLFNGKIAKKKYFTVMFIVVLAFLGYFLYLKYS